MYALSRLVYANIRGGIPRVDGITAMLEGVKPASGEYTNVEDAIQGQILECSTRPSVLPQAEVHFSTTELVPISGDVIKSSGRSLHFACNALEQGK